jgi:hypothetical protein
MGQAGSSACSRRVHLKLCTQLWQGEEDGLASLSTSEEDLPPALLEKIPIPSRASQVILVKVSLTSRARLLLKYAQSYINDDALQSSTMFDFIGVLDVSALPTSEFADENAPHHQVFALHAILHQPVDLSPKLPKAPQPDQWTSTREKLIRYLAQGVSGDLVAAEFLLLALLARV